MAYAALVSLEQTIDRILNQDRFSTSPQEKHHIISLDKYVISFQAFLDDFPGEAKNLEAQIRDTATAAEDIIECFMLEPIPEPIPLRNGCIIFMWIDALTESKFEYELNKVAEKMEAIAAEVVESKNSVVIKDEKLDMFSIGGSSSSSSVAPVGKFDVVGFDDDLLEIKDRLAGKSPKLQYLAISGMGGIGKTTLARNAYEDQLIQEHFDIRAWVTISQDYRVRKIISCLLDSMKEFNPNRSEGSVEEMADRIHKILCGRRYLIVMDDIWSTEVLDDVRKLFPDFCNGSRIMLTTRLSDVAAYADSSPYKMHLMDKKKSWDLLKLKISRDVLSDKLEKIGREIARRCSGLPLAVVVVAGILSSVSETPASWAEVAKNMKKTTLKNDQMDEVVSLGYNHLPHRLRACLLYMGLLPEDYSIRVSLLIKLWIAEGFLKHPVYSSKSLEADAEEHLEDLVRRNLILVTGRKYNGKIKSCGLHDMVRDTCIRMLAEEKHIRHIVTAEDDQGFISKRSVLCLGYGDSNLPFERFRLLRVLHGPEYAYDSGKMLKLYQLRHLRLSICKMLPADISQFQNLQSLIIETRWSRKIQLPSSIWKLRQLRHLIVSGGNLPPDPDETSALENLQTLKKVVFDVTNIAYETLQRFPNLIKLGLVLRPLYPYLVSLEHDLNESLVCLRQLEQLNIIFTYGSLYPRYFSAAIPDTLKKFTLEKGRASASFLEAIGSLPHLQVLKLTRCIFDDAAWEVRGGEFPKLKMLQLRDLREITAFIVEDGSTTFPMLSCLRIYRCPHLLELSDEIGDFQSLQLIEVSHCGKGVCDWARRVEEQQDTLQVRIINPSGLKHLYPRCIVT